MHQLIGRTESEDCGHSGSLIASLEAPADGKNCPHVMELCLRLGIPVCRCVLSDI